MPRLKKGLKIGFCNDHGVKSKLLDCPRDSRTHLRHRAFDRACLRAMPGFVSAA
jgi:hypothetical protein